MPGREFRGVMAFRTCETFTPDMLIMFTGIIIVVLVRSTCCTVFMTGSTLGIDINGTGQPVRRGLAAMTFVAGAGAVPVVSGRTALGVETGREAKISSAFRCTAPSWQASQLGTTEPKPSAV